MDEIAKLPQAPFVPDAERKAYRQAMEPGFVTLVETHCKIGPTTFLVRIADDVERKWLRIRVVERVFGASYGFSISWPYEDHAQLLAQMEGFRTREPRPLKRKWLVRGAFRLIGRPLLGALGPIDENAPFLRRYDAYLARLRGQKLFVIRDAPSFRDGPQMTYWVCIPVQCMEAAAAKLKAGGGVPEEA